MPTKLTLIAPPRYVRPQYLRRTQLIRFDLLIQSIDFLTMYPSLAEVLYKNQPPFNATGVWKYANALRSCFPTNNSD